MQSAAKALGASVEMVKSGWPTLMKDFQEKCDVAVGGISVTLERQKSAFFTSPYMVNGKAPITKCENVAKFQTIADIDKPGVTVAGAAEIAARAVRREPGVAAAIRRDALAAAPRRHRVQGLDGPVDAPGQSQWRIRPIGQPLAEVGLPMPLQSVVDDLRPDLPRGLRRADMPIVVATSASLAG